MKKYPILFFAFANDYANEGIYLEQLEKERVEIEKVLTPVQNCEIQLRIEATRKRVRDIFNRYQSDIKIFHFSGHASGEGVKLRSEGESRETQITYVEGLAPLVASYKGVRLAFLNGCSTASQVEEFHKADIPAVIATTYPIRDSVAAQFAIEFYSNIALNRSIKQSFEAANNSLLAEFKVRSLYRDDSIFDFGKGVDDDLRRPYKLYYDDRDSSVISEGLNSWVEDVVPLESSESIVPSTVKKTQIPPDDYLLCDRTTASKEFKKPFPVNQQTPEKEPKELPQIRKPQFFILHAPDIEKSESLVLRFLVHSIDPLLELDETAEKGIIGVDFLEKGDFLHEDNSWPMEMLLSNFKTAIKLKGREISARKIIEHLGNKDVIFIEHMILAETWHSSMAEFIIDEYEKFWDITLGEGEPHVLIIFNIIYTSYAKGIFDKIRGKIWPVSKDLKRISTSLENCTMIPRLENVPKGEVVMWQKKRCPSEPDIAEDLFGKKKSLPMEDVQQRLISETDKYNNKLLGIQKL